MVDGLHIQNRTKEPLGMVLTRVEKGSRGRDGESDLISVHSKPV
jgi:hypothetical protein